MSSQGSLSLNSSASVISADEREILKCEKCTLVQYRTKSGCCRRCDREFDAAPQPQAEVPNGDQHMRAEDPQMKFNTSRTIRRFREKRRLTQRALALKMGVPRTYISKLENDGASPNLSSLEKLANAFGMSMPDLVEKMAMENHTSVEPFRELLSDPLVVSIRPYLPSLSKLNRFLILNALETGTFRQVVQ
jgi:transcriptional regulator with XRE-family HTH domain